MAPNAAGDPRDEEVEADTPSRTLREFESLVAGRVQPKHIFRLYVAGNSTRSRLAITNVREICERYLANNYELVRVRAMLSLFQARKANRSSRSVAPKPPIVSSWRP